MNLPDSDQFQSGNRHRLDDVNAAAKSFNLTAGRSKPQSLDCDSRCDRAAEQNRHNQHNSWSEQESATNPVLRPWIQIVAQSICHSSVFRRLIWNGLRSFG